MTKASPACQAGTNEIMVQKCCAERHEGRSSLSSVLEAAVDDPTLQDCCARDLKEQAYASWLKRELLARDRIDSRTEIARQTFHPRLDFDPASGSEAGSLSGSPSDAETGICHLAFAFGLQHTESHTVMR